jgi:tRNA A37 threonylcarbamoyladenosine modification protein TsaB
MVAGDARRNRLFVQRFEAPGLPTCGPLLLTIDEAATTVGPGEVVAVGSGAQALAAAAAGRGFGPVRALLADLQPDAAILLRMAGLRADLLSPVYLRPPDARPPVGGALRRAR